MLKMKPLVLAVASALVTLPQMATAGNNAVIDLTPGQTEVALPQDGIINGNSSEYRTGISAIGNGTDLINATLTGSNASITVGEYNPDTTGGFTTHGIQARQGATITVGTSNKPLSKFEIQNHGKTTLATGLMAWRGPNGTLADAHININSDIVDINVSSDDYWAYGLYTYNNTTDKNIADADRSSIVINAKDINIDVSTKTVGTSVGIIAWSQAKVKLEADRIKVKAYRAINTRGDSIVEINSSGNKNSVVQIDGNITLEYNGPSSGTPIDSTVTINLLNSDSYWNGNLECIYDKLDPKKDKEALLDVNNVHLGLANGATWTPDAVETFESTDEKGQFNGSRSVALNNLAMDGGVINVKASNVDVVVEKMTGTGGTINLATDLNAAPDQQAGTVTVQNSSQNANLTVQLTNKDMTKVLTADDVTPEQAKPLLGNVDAKDANKTLQVQEGKYEAGFDINNAGETVSHGPNTLMQSTLELATATPLALNRILMNDVRKRLGDIRSAQGTSGAWARYDGGRLSGLGGYENDFNTIQVGVDTQPTADPLRLGMAFSYTKSDTDYARGSADMDAYSLAGYGLWLGENGQFVDVVARMATAKTDMNVDGVNKGAMDNLALSLSGEFGWRFDVMNNFFVEPQIEATYTYVDAEKLTLNDGSNYSFDAADSLLGRTGLAFGMKCPNNKGNVYAKVSAVHEFLGDTAVTGGNGTVYSLDGKDTWIEYGLGANFNLTDSTYIWADVERTSGGALDEDYRATLGVRYAW